MQKKWTTNCERLLIRVAGKYYSGALFLASTNPQYDKRLFTDLPVLTLKLQENWLYWFTRTRALRILFFCEHRTFFLVWPQRWSLVDVSQQGVDFSKISKMKIFFWFDFHRCLHRPSKIGHHYRKQSGTKIEVFKKWQ